MYGCVRMFNNAGDNCDGLTNCSCMKYIARIKIKMLVKIKLTSHSIANFAPK